MRWPTRTPKAPKPPGTDTTSTADGGGLFRRLGDFVVRRPWVVVACWVALAVVLSPLTPYLAAAIQKNPVAPLPANAPSTVANQQMTAAFHEANSENTLLVVLTSKKKLGAADEQVYRTLVGNLRRDHKDVVMLQDFVDKPALRETLTSQDGEAWLLPIGLSGDLASPEAGAAYTRVVDTVKSTVAGSPVTAHLTGPAATVSDLIDISLRDQARISSAILALLLGILVIIYRKPATVMLPLITIGFSVTVAQAVVGGAALLGLSVSNQTIVLLSGMLAGAGTDYAVFLISRYHDFLRLGADSDRAVKSALSSIGKVIAASAASVAITFLGMSFTRLQLFSSIGPALAIAIAVAFVAAVTLLPAIIVLAGRRGWVSPRRDLTTRFWRRSGIRIVRRPRAHLVASLLVLVILAGCVGIVRYNYDDRKSLPDSVTSSRGYVAMAQHFPLNSIIPQYLLVQSPHDLRTPKALADLEQMAQRISQLPGVATVRGITRPAGVPLEAASTTVQGGEVGRRLNDASVLIADRTDDLDRLASGADQLATSLSSLRDQMSKLMSGVGSVLTALTAIQNQFGGNRSFAQMGDGDRLTGGMRGLGDTVQATFGKMAGNLEWVDPVVIALDGSPYCDSNPVCSDARDQFHALQTARNDGAFDRLAGQLQSTGPQSNLSQTVAKLTQSMTSLTGSMGSPGLANPAAGTQSPLGNMQQGFDSLADGSRQVADGVQQLVDQTKRMGGDLGDASAFLLAMKSDASTPAMSGFYIPPKLLASDNFKKAAAFFVSTDGHAVRYLIETKYNPFSTAAMDQVISITDTARGAQKNTALADASISMTGYPASLRDARDYYNHDIRFIIIMTITVVLLILIALLRAIVAPLYLIGSVIISYLAALGIGVVTFQFILGQELHWSIPGLTFIILVAMGADYNMLLISRIREESPRGIRSGVIHTVGSTGGVITAAGVIFAASMFGLLFANISTIVQAGFVVGTGILLDTFVVRTITVPAMAVLVGRANWWPSRWRPRTVPRQRPQNS
jgi:putative drug exporter of the RND superfamily